MKISSDTPKDVIEMLKAIDFSKIDKSMLEKLPDLERMVNVHIPHRERGAISFVEIDIQNCPQKIIDLINKKDFTKVGFLVKAMAMPVIKSWMRKNLPIKEGVYL